MIPTDEIIEMAKECGLPLTYVPHDDDTFSPHVDGLVAFANLVAARAAVIEREAIKAIADRQTQYYFERATEAYGLSEERFNMFHAMKEAAQFIGEQIDERGELA